MTEETQKAEIMFGLITHPSRSQWPKHGCFIMRTDDGKRKSSDVMFSVEAARDFIKKMVKNGELESDQAATMEQAIASTGLPASLTRFDRLARTFNDQAAKRLIDRFCGQTKPEEGSDIARFELCEEGEFCGHEHCGQFPLHVALFMDGLNTPFSVVNFSRQGAEQHLTEAVESGALTPEEAVLCRADIGILGVSPVAEQVDRFVSNLPQSYWADHLDVLFGLRKPEQPARFAFCGEHCQVLHFYLYDKTQIGKGVQSRFDAQHLLEQALKFGYLNEEEGARLRELIPTLDLPEGGQDDSIYTNPLAAMVFDLGKTLGVMITLEQG